jgi:transposase, IS5 family
MLKKESKQKDYFDEVLEKLVKKDHVFRKLKQMIDFDQLLMPFENLYSEIGCPSEPLTRGFKCLLIQFWNDLSDREASQYISDSMAARWFCGYKIDEETPAHSYFGKLRDRIGVDNLTKIFNTMTSAIEKQGYIGKTFSFVDSSSMMAKVSTWKARDKANSDDSNDETDDDGNPTINNNNLEKYSTDPDAKFGCKGKDKHWLGYKRHQQVDMKQGIITDVKITSANVSDATAFIDEKLCPESGMVFLDKGYESKKVEEYIEKNDCYSAAIKKNNRKNKNFKLDSWRSRVRMPFENTFSKLQKRCRYWGKIKTQMQVTMESIVHNLKRMIVLGAPELVKM